MIMEQTKFWLVWCVDGGRPTYKHFTKKSAVDEAKRLAGEVPNGVFAVMACVAAYATTITPVESVQIIKREPLTADDDGIPF